MSGHNNTPTLKSLLILLLILYVGSISILGFTIKEMQRAINERNEQITKLNSQLSQIRSELSSLKEKIKTYNASTIFSYEKIYEKIKDSVVVIRGKVIVQFSPFWTEYSNVQGSGFIYNYTGKIIVITNNHVVDKAINITVSILDGETYPAQVIGKDPYSDLAILSVEAPPHKLKPAVIVSSSTLKIGDPVVAVGNPFGLAGSITTGVVSHLGRTISESEAGGYPIADVIQISTPINPGNSGGPLLNIFGEVVGVTTAIIANAQGVGFAIPSDTILRELPYLIEGKKYPHPWLGVVGIDMNFDLAKIMNVNVTYGWLIVDILPNSPAEKYGLRGGDQTVLIGGRSVKIGGDIIIMMNGTRIRNGDDLSTYLERNTIPGDKIKITVVRGGEIKDIIVKLGSRPYPQT
ncbi:PDZ domain-containing protein [Candidatus Bathyarchaeota archaeon]|nr:MAG: PDZ domain-containing protein [Candidatus Bathyarchaeota archaeon]